MALNPSVTTLSGLAADRPASPTYTGLHYYATDTNAFSVWDGSAWQTDVLQGYLLAAGTRPLTAQWGVGPWSFLVTGSATPATPGTAGLRAVWALNDNSGLKVITKAGNTYSMEGATLAKSQSATAAGDTIANVAVITDFATNYTIPANALSVGRAVFVQAYGVFGTSATAVTDTMAVRLDATAAGTTGAVTDNASLTNRGWSLNGILTCRATGSAAGLVEFQGQNIRNMSVSAANVIDMENTAGIFLDTTVSHVLKLSQTWGTANTGNTTTLRSLAVEWLGPEVS